MNIVEDKEFRWAILKKIEQREFKERKGIHQSDLCYCLNKQVLRRLHPIEATDSDILLYSLGWSTQRWLTGQDTDLPEQEVDGIIVTLDAQAFLNDKKDEKNATWVACPWELKASFQSSERPVEENLPWIRQIMAQCYVMKTTEARLTRLEIMGNWKSVFGKKEQKDLPENRKPTLSAWRLTFTQDEIDKNWAWLLSRRGKFQEMLKEGKTISKIEAIPSGQEYECERCPYKGGLCVVD